MLILTKLKFRFSQGEDSFISAGGNAIETAPDWIQRDPLFPLVIQDGTLVCVEKTPIFDTGTAAANKNDTPDKSEDEPEVKNPTATRKRNG